MGYYEDRDQEHSKRKADFLINNHTDNHVTMVLTDMLLWTGIYAMDHHHSFRIVLLFLISLNYPSSVPFSLYMTDISDLHQFLFLEKPYMQELNHASRIHCISPYLCPDCSETWNHSLHYRWLSPENQKRSDWPETHGGSVCRDSSPLKNLFGYHLRWRAPSLREGGDTYTKVRKERRTVIEMGKELDGNKGP